MKIYFDEAGVRAMIRKACKAAGGQNPLARRWRVSRGFLASVVTGRERPSRKILRHLGLRRVVYYVDA